MSYTKEQEGDIRYVYVTDPSSSGWPAMVKTVRDSDTAKIADCKEDIDTLLVFAGLYSAVLSAFIIESYKTLQQDNQDVMVGLMRQLVAQNFIFGPGYLNSTTPFPELPPFEPPLWAIRVNVLWFISLILSLAAASFGMLVKQWLREYLALEYTAPQERLRARQYRNPALSKWKVFEVAAILPLLLQVALGLFFIGLCFFTSAVHSSIKHTTVPVVAAWAFLLLMTTIAPLFSPRCPFKTTFLKSTLKVGRRYVAPACRHSAFVIRRRFHDLVHTATLPRHVHSVFCTSKRVYGAVRVMLELALGGLLETRRGFQYELSGIKEALVEEEVFVKTEQEDTEILMSVDSLMSDDGLLSTMVEVLQHQTDPRSIIQFVLQIINRRISQTLPLENLTYIPELHTLSKRAWTAATDAVANTLARHARIPLANNSAPWVLDAVILLLSRSPHGLSDAAACCLQNMISEEGANTTPLALRLYNGASGKDPKLSGRLRSLIAIQDIKLSLASLLSMYFHLLRQDRQHDHHSLFTLLRDYSSSEALLLSSKPILDDLFGFLMQYVVWILSFDYPKEVDGFREAVRIILEFGGRIGTHPASPARLCKWMLRDSSSYAYMLLSQFSALHAQARVPEDQEHLLAEVYVSFQKEDREMIDDYIIRILRAYRSGKIDNPNMQHILDFVRLCRLLLRAHFAPGKEDLELFNDVWTALARAIWRYHQTKGWEVPFVSMWWESQTPPSQPEELLKDDEKFACECLDMIMAHPECVAQRKSDDSDSGYPIPGELVRALWQFVPDQERTRFEQLRRILPVRRGGLPMIPPAVNPDRPRVRWADDEEVTDDEDSEGGENIENARRTNDSDDDGDGRKEMDNAGRRHRRDRKGNSTKVDIAERECAEDKHGEGTGGGKGNSREDPETSGGEDADPNRTTSIPKNFRQSLRRRRRRERHVK